MVSLSQSTSIDSEESLGRMELDCLIRTHSVAYKATYMILWAYYPHSTPRSHCVVRPTNTIIIVAGFHANICRDCTVLSTFVRHCRHWHCAWLVNHSSLWRKVCLVSSDRETASSFDRVT